MSAAVKAMPGRPLYPGGPDVSILGFGSAPLGDLYARLDDAAAIAAVGAALSAGITLFDTSPLYGHGLAEHRCGTALRRAPRDSFVLSSKVGRVIDPFHPPAAPADGVAAPGNAGGMPFRAEFDYSVDGVLRSLEQSLLRLGTDRIDVLLIHDVDIWTHGADAIEARFSEAMNGAYVALDRLRSEGVIGAIGVGVNEAEMCARFARAGDFDVMLLAGRYTLLEQAALDDFLPLALEKQIGIMMGGVFNSGILATGAVDGANYNYQPAPPDIFQRTRAIERVCAAHGVALAVAAVKFVLGHPAIRSAVLGAVTPVEVIRNVAAITTPVPAALWSDLRSEGLMRADAPLPDF